MRKLQPNVWIVGIELLTSTQVTPAIITTTTSTSSRVNPRKSVSLSRRLPPPSNRATLLRPGKALLHATPLSYVHQDQAPVLLPEDCAFLRSFWCARRTAGTRSAVRRREGEDLPSLPAVPLADNPGVARRVLLPQVIDLICPSPAVTMGAGSCA